MALRYAPNLTMLYGEVPFLDRFARAAEDGFDAVEFQFPYDPGFGAIKSRIDEFGLSVVLYNLHSGEPGSGELGSLSNPALRDYFRWSFTTALDGAKVLGCPRLHAMFGNKVPGLEPAAQIECALENLAWAAPQAAEAGVKILLEPLNATDYPNFFAIHTDTGVQVVKAANHPNVRLQYDVYHAQMREGNLINTITACFPLIEHIQIADAPGRHEPGTGEINYPAIFATLEKLNYRGYIGLEYRPSADTEASLRWLPRESRGRR